jgi:pimeloyl-ACP methyl ester carboxylesterase
MWDVPEDFDRVVLEFLADVESSTAPAPPSEPAFCWGISGWTAGVVHRQAGRRKNIVLIHGLGMSSAYFEPLAEALFTGGWDPVAPDLPGFGESVNARAGGAGEHAAVLARWADAAGIRDAVWLGHSIGCNAVAALARARPDLVRMAVHVGPLWTRHRWPTFRLFGMLALDALREPLALYRYVIPAYWRTGIARWWLTWRKFLPDIDCPAPDGMFIAGDRDPIPDRTCVRDIITVPGAHACTVSHPEEVATTLLECGDKVAALARPL